MRINIASKLFLGFLVVICLNVFFLAITPQIENVNVITRILQKQHDVKNDLLRLKTLHRVQGPSIISFERLGRSESAANFREINGKIVVLLDTINDKIGIIQHLDSVVMLSSGVAQPYKQPTPLKSTIDSIVLYNDVYSNTFDSIVIGRTAKVEPKNLKVKSILLEQVDTKLTALLDSSEEFIDQRTNTRLKEIENRVRDIKNHSIYIIVGVALVAVFFSFFFSKYITNSLRRLKETASTIGRGDFNVDPHGYPSDEIGDLASAFFDMSIDLKNKEEEVIKSRRMAAIGEVVASVNHEINNPLMIISGNAQFLEMIMEGYPQEMRERVKTILEETERISRVTKKLREIKNPIVEDYTSSGEQMINLEKSSLD